MLRVSWVVTVVPSSVETVHHTPAESKVLPGKYSHFGFWDRLFSLPIPNVGCWYRTHVRSPLTYNCYNYAHKHLSEYVTTEFGHKYKT